MKRSKRVGLTLMGTVGTLSLAGCSPEPQPDVNNVRYMRGVYATKTECLAAGNPAESCNLIESGTQTGRYMGPRFLFIPHLGGGGFYPQGGASAISSAGAVRSEPAPPNIRSGVASGAISSSPRGGFGSSASRFGSLGS